MKNSVSIIILSTIMVVSSTQAMEKKSLFSKLMRSFSFSKHKNKNTSDQTQKESPLPTQESGGPIITLAALEEERTNIAHLRTSFAESIPLETLLKAFANNYEHLEDKGTIQEQRTLVAHLCTLFPVENEENLEGKKLTTLNDKLAVERHLLRFAFSYAPLKEGDLTHFSHEVEQKKVQDIKNVRASTFALFAQEEQTADTFKKLLLNENFVLPMHIIYDVKD